MSAPNQMVALAGELLGMGTPRFDPDARAYEAFSLNSTVAGHGSTRSLGALRATNLDAAMAEATERWAWDRGDRLGIREIGQEDAPLWPFDKQPVDRLHIYAIRRSAPIRWEPTRDLMRTVPVYRYKLDAICAVDLIQFRLGDEGKTA